MFASWNLYLFFSYILFLSIYLIFLLGLPYASIAPPFFPLFSSPFFLPIIPLSLCQQKNLPFLHFFFIQYFPGGRSENKSNTRFRGLSYFSHRLDSSFPFISLPLYLLSSLFPTLLFPQLLISAALGKNERLNGCLIEVIVPFLVKCWESFLASCSVVSSPSLPYFSAFMVDQKYFFPFETLPGFPRLCFRADQEYELMLAAGW